MEAIFEKWEQILQYVKEKHDISQISFETWLKPLKICTSKGNTLYIEVPWDNTSVNNISRKYGLPLKASITEMTGFEYQLEFVLADKAKELKSTRAKKPAVLPERSNLNPNYTFETFVAGRNNQFARLASMSVAKTPGKAYNPLYINSGPGLGKTHLMHSIGNFILDHNPDCQILYVTAEEFANEVIESIKTGDVAAMTKLREKYCTADVLMIDNIQFLVGKESMYEELFHIFYVLHSADKQIILASDKPFKEMEIFRERIRWSFRFERGLLADIDLPDYETRMAILRRKVEADEMELSDDILNYIANSIKRSIRELESALNRLLVYGSIAKTDITMDIAVRELQNIITPVF